MRWIKRNSERKRLSCPATIYRRDRSALCGCMVQDMSETGARLKIDKDDGGAEVEVPQQFFLSFTARKEVLSDFMSVVRACEKVWRREDEIGVKFLSKRARP